MRSVRPILLLAPVVLLAGCGTTQERNTRAKLDAQRVLASRKPVLVRAPHPDVRVDKVALVHHDGGAAVVVELHSTAARPLNDLPISVGVRRGHGRVRYLNRGTGLGYYQTHVAALPARGRATWVLALPRARSLDGAPFARVGLPANPPLTVASALPALRVAPASPLGPVVRVRVTNDTSVPQYGLPVYALARRGTRYTAAGRAIVRHLGTGQTKQVRVRLVGTTGGARLTLEAQPSMFQ